MHTLRGAANRLYRHLPESWKSEYRARRTRSSYLANTRGQSIDDTTAAAARAWFQSHARPLTIVIPSYNDVPLVREAVASVERTYPTADWRIIIVDDYIDPDVVARLRQLEGPRVSVIEKDTRRGFSGTINVGMAAADDDIILMNSDIVAQPGWLEALQYSAYAIDPHIGLVSPRLVYPDGRLQYAGHYHARQHAPQWWSHFHTGAPATRPAANVAGYNRGASGACLYITREAFDRLGFFDDEFWLGFEDVDYAMRAWKLGVRSYYQPAALLIHHESASRGYSQGHRELASMRRFWGRWEEQLLTRHVPDDAPLDVVLGPASGPLWEAYVRSLADAQTARVVTYHRVSSAERDEDVIARLSGGDRIVLAADWTAAETVWLATAAGGLPVYLLPGIESASHPGDPALQAHIIAGYRPDFDYIAPNPWTQRQLQHETAWEARARIAPALVPAALPVASERVVVVIGASAPERDGIRLTLREFDHVLFALDDVDSSADLEAVVRRRPRAVIDLVARANSLVPLALMSCGAAYISPSDPVLGHQVMDGYNALRFDPRDPGGLTRALVDAISRDAVWSELRRNGHATAERAAALAPEEFDRALKTFAASPI
ncbi:glycosyltransferase [Microbacterium sp. T32]|uniref:glycosyltransferase n=1 Tax=Microbacterium sp. T32 TaxID=1776083 RepID=UPI001E31E476|nr:glycosyltransferase [Microbacterium sp. T32]